jgi:phosphoribosylformylglycinamidine cyclo-ligase
MSKNERLTYADAGVDIEAGNALVRKIGPIAKATARAGANVSLGGFAGLFDPKAAGYDDPLLVAATDGVGTKLKIAIESGVHDTVGIDLVAMCVNDLIVQGAEPLFFLDYFASAKLKLDVAEAVIAGIADGCKQANCALIGGETAEMPGMYAEGDYDLAGFCVGAVERSFTRQSQSLEAGDVIIGLASTGVHSNGFSLVRKIIDHVGLRYSAPAPFDPERSIAEALLTPTQIYVRSCLGAMRSGTIKTMAHITGGGLLENIPRVLPQGLRANIDAGAWALPKIFSWMKNAGGLSAFELSRTFNCGIGMAVIISADKAERYLKEAKASGIEAYPIGNLIRHDGAPDVYITGKAGVWGYDEDWAITTEGNA